MLTAIAYRQTFQNSLHSDTAFLDFYTVGAGVPTDIVGISLGTKLGRVTVGALTWPNATSGGVVTADITKLTDETNAPAAGNARYAIGLKSDGTTITGVWSAGNAGDKEADGSTGVAIVLNNKSIALGGSIHVTAWVDTFGVGAI